MKRKGISIIHRTLTEDGESGLGFPGKARFCSPGSPAKKTDVPDAVTEKGQWWPLVLI